MTGGYLELVTAPGREPVSLDEVKEHLRILGNDEDSHLIRLTTAARHYVEEAVRRSLITQTWKLSFDYRFPVTMYLHRSPVQSVTHVKYIDDSGVQQTVTTSVYDVITNREPGLVLEAYDQTWPAPVRHQKNAVEVQYVCGYGDDPDNVPGPLRQAILIVVATMHEFPEAVTDLGRVASKVPMNFDYIINPYVLHPELTML